MSDRIQKWIITIRDRCLWFLTAILRGIGQVPLLPISSYLSPNNPTNISLFASTFPYPQVKSPQNEQESQIQEKHLDKLQRLPSIYSGIGVGVYQGEVVTFRLMAIGERRWVVSKLRFEDLSQLPDSIVSEVSLTLCLLRLHRIQSELVKNGLQTRGGIELMKSYCPLVGSLDKLLVGEADGNNLAIPIQLENQQRQSQCPLVCSKVQKCQVPFTPQSNTKGDMRQ